MFGAVYRDSAELHTENVARCAKSDFKKYIYGGGGAYNIVIYINFQKSRGHRPPAPLNAVL